MEVQAGCFVSWSVAACPDWGTAGSIQMRALGSGGSSNISWTVFGSNIPNTYSAGVITASVPTPAASPVAFNTSWPDTTFGWVFCQRGSTYLAYRPRFHPNNSQTSDWESTITNSTRSFRAYVDTEVESGGTGVLDIALIRHDATGDSVTYSIDWLDRAGTWHAVTSASTATQGGRYVNASVAVSDFQEIRFGTLRPGTSTWDYASFVAPESLEELYAGREYPPLTSRPEMG